LRATRQIGSSLMVPAIGKGREEQEMRLVEIVGRYPHCDVLSLDFANMISLTPVGIRLSESVDASSRQPYWRVSGKGRGQCGGCDAPR
jgi:hypothetical protein